VTRIPPWSPGYAPRADQRAGPREGYGLATQPLLTPSTVRSTRRQALRVLANLAGLALAQASAE